MFSFLQYQTKVTTVYINNERPIITLPAAKSARAFPVPAQRQEWRFAVSIETLTVHRSCQKFEQHNCPVSHEDKRTAKLYVKIMSAGGLKTISESPTDSLRDSDQFSVKVNLIRIVYNECWVENFINTSTFVLLCFSFRGMC